MMSLVGCRRAALTFFLGTMAASMLAGVVIAHSDLVSSTPKEGAIVPSPFSGPIVLTFTEDLAGGSKADLVGADGRNVASATVAAKTMTVTPAAPLDPGAYEVRWISVADDGDLLRGIVHFTVAAAAATPSATPSAAPSAPSSAPPAATPSPSVPPSAGPSPSGGSDTSGGGGNDVLLPIVVALVVLAAGAAYLLTQRNRPSNPA